MVNPSARGCGTKAGFFWGGVCFLCWLWTYFRLPEPKGRTYGELDVLFERKVSARNFKTTQVDQFSGEHLDIIKEQVETVIEKGNHKELV
jgi:MFS transporter, SP family, general alpha glucoside:H+ symporter